MPVLLVIMLFALIQLIFAVFGLSRSEFLGFGLRHVAYWSHIGGFIFGIGVALLANMALHGQRDYLIDLAKKEYNAGNTLEATQCYEQLIKYDPDNAEAYAELGRLWAILELSLIHI